MGRCHGTGKWFVASHPEYIFYVTEIGCGHAGHEVKEIAPLFKDAVNLENIYLPDAFWQVLNRAFSERLKTIISHYAVAPMDFIDGIGLNATHAMNLIWGTEYPSVNDIQKILIKYPEVSARWLLLGEGGFVCKCHEEWLKTKKRPEVEALQTSYC